MSAAPLFALLALAVSAPGDVVPVSSPATSPAKVTKAVDDDHLIICKSEIVTGTRFSHRTCKTKTQWDEDTRNARDYLNQVTSGCKSNPSC